MAGSFPDRAGFARHRSAESDIREGVVGPFTNRPPWARKSRQKVAHGERGCERSASRFGAAVSDRRF
jgi:hypothetical protein